MKVAGKTISYKNFGKSNYRSSRAGSSKMQDSFEREPIGSEQQYVQFYRTQKVKKKKSLATEEKKKEGLP